MQKQQSEPKALLFNTLNKHLMKVKATLKKSVDKNQVAKKPVKHFERDLEEQEKWSHALRTEGNNLYKEQLYDCAQHKYTLSLLAAVESATKAMAYANRSAALFRLGFFEDCLKDISRALAHDYPDNLKYKLYIREAKCLFINPELGSWHECLLRAQDVVIDRKSKKEVSELLQNGFFSKKERHFELHKNLRPNLTSKVPPLSYGVSDTVPCLSSAVAIAYNVQLGRHLVAKRDLEIGDVVIVEEAFVKAIDPSCTISFCSYCCNIIQASIPCDHCKNVQYCNEDCKANDWDAIHKICCSLEQKQIIPDLPGIFGGQKSEEIDLFLLAKRLIIMLIAKLGGEKEILKQLNTETKLDWKRPYKHFGRDASPVDNLKALLLQEDNVGHLNQDFTSSVTAPALAVATRFASSFQRPQEVEQFASFVMKMILLVGFNSKMLHSCDFDVFGSAKSVEKDFGLAIYLASSFINHSCSPNMIRVSYGSTAVYRIIKPVAKGEELTESYHVGMQIPSESRKRVCVNECCFHCQCLACRNDWPWMHEMPERFILDELLDVCFNVGVKRFPKLSLNLCIQFGVPPDSKMFASIAHIQSLMHVSKYYPDKLYEVFEDLIKMHLKAHGNARFNRNSKEYIIGKQSLDLLALIKGAEMMKID
ncbi:SET and MYND domain-containing protein 4-like [Neocloeon triangulifer]|uniref:SET and MYND domain-containing protein 4-like n=1 Tax=Neocloeon triangulifer TaxID=2078957 RepID=UPI00286F835E|nr:SET and MYND domain-containing protein 4-like [Neocloeon triangulifer]